MHFERKSGNFYVLSAVSSLALSRLCGQKTFFSFPPHFSPQPPLFLNSILRVASTKKSFGPSLPLSQVSDPYPARAPFHHPSSHRPKRLAFARKSKGEREKKRVLREKRRRENRIGWSKNVPLSFSSWRKEKREREACSTLLLFFSSYCDAISCLHFPTKSTKKENPPQFTILRTKAASARTFTPRTI